MNKYLFRTNVTVKENDRTKYWIDKDIVRDFSVKTDTLPQALSKYRDFVEGDSCSYIDISDNALRTKQAMYEDSEDWEPKQVGYVITGRTELDGVNKYVDLWVEILTIVDTDFS